MSSDNLILCIVTVLAAMALVMSYQKMQESTYRESACSARKASVSARAAAAADDVPITESQDVYEEADDADEVVDADDALGQPRKKLTAVEIANLNQAVKMTPLTSSGCSKAIGKSIMVPGICFEDMKPKKKPKLECMMFGVPTCAFDNDDDLQGEYVDGQN